VGDTGGQAGPSEYSVSDGETAEIDEIVSVSMPLAEWSPLGVAVAAMATVENGNSVTTTATLQIDSFVDVRDSQGQEVPIFQVCTESGREY
jgi:hypothetical protein